MQTVIIIAGPTAVGKTASAIRLAQSLATEIISADSRQCFKELNIGVAKPSPQELAAVHHYFIGSHSVHEEITAATFEQEALTYTAGIFAHHPATPATIGNGAGSAVMVGGTGLYIKAFAEGLDPMPAIDPVIRESIQQSYQQLGISWLQDQIRESDPAFYEKGEILNPQRLMRALEVKMATGRSILDWRTRGKKHRPFQIQKIGLHLPKELLHERIHDRVDQMMTAGLLAEAESLIPLRHLNALQTVGYRELFDYFDGKFTLDQAVEEIKKNTRHYAKRQITWFTRDPDFKWIDAREFAADPLQFINTAQ